MEEEILYIKEYEILERSGEENKIVIWGDIPYWLYVNDIFVRLLGLINGRTRRELLKIVHSEISNNVSIEDIDSVLDTLRKADVLKNINCDEDEKGDIRGCVLQYITLNITDTCNLFCKHCYIDAGQTKRTFLNLEKAIYIVNKLKQIAIDSCNIIVSGGEATLNSECLEILEYISNNTCWTITLVTNGTMITDSLASSLSKIRHLSVQVSLDGATSDVHDEIRGKGNYEKTIKGIKKLTDYGNTVYLSPIVTEKLYGELDDFFELAKDLKAKAVFLQPINNVGRAKYNKMIRVDDSKVFLKVLDIYRKDYDLIHMVKGTLEAKYLSNIKVLDKCDYCGTGSSTLAIQPNGDLYPCPNLIDGRMRIGNIFRDDIFELWMNSDILEGLRRLNVDKNLDEKCKKCCVKHFCGGGCRGIAFQNTGDIHACSGTCEYEKKQRIEMLWALVKDDKLFAGEINRHLEISEKKEAEICSKIMELKRRPA